MDAIDLAAELRDDAAVFRRYGQDALAATVEACAAKVEQWWRGWWHEELTYDSAERETGTPRSTLEKRVQRKEIPNAGREGRPRFRRCDLFPGLAGARLRVVEEEPDLADEVLAARLEHRT